MADTAKSLTPQQQFVKQIGAGTGAIQASNWQVVDHALANTYAPTITWQDTTSAATYASVADVLPAQDYYNILSS